MTDSNPSHPTDVWRLSASWTHNPPPHPDPLQISPQWAAHREIRKEHREERESELAADLEMSRTAEQSAAAMAQMVIKSGFILNGGGIIAIPAVATLFSLDAEKMLSQLVWGFRCQGDFIVCVPDFVGAQSRP